MQQPWGLARRQRHLSGTPAVSSAAGSPCLLALHPGGTKAGGELGQDQEWVFSRRRLGLLLLGDSGQGAASQTGTLLLALGPQGLGVMLPYRATLPSLLPRCRWRQGGPSPGTHSWAPTGPQDMSVCATWTWCHVPCLWGVHGALSWPACGRTAWVSHSGPSVSWLLRDRI